MQQQRQQGSHLRGRIIVSRVLTLTGPIVILVVLLAVPAIGADDVIAIPDAATQVPALDALRAACACKDYQFPPLVVQEGGSRGRIDVPLGPFRQLAHFARDILENHGRRIARLRGLHLRAAIALYSVEHDGPPDSLDQVQTALGIPAVLDPFSGESFKYQRDGGEGEVDCVCVTLAHGANLVRAVEC